MITADSIVTDTTAAVTRCTWSLQTWNGEPVNSEREEQYRQDGRYKITIHKNIQKEESGFGTWRREGKFIYMAIGGYPEDHTFEILGITASTLTIYFHDQQRKYEWECK